MAMISRKPRRAFKLAALPFLSAFAAYCALCPSQPSAMPITVPPGAESAPASGTPAGPAAPRRFAGKAPEKVPHFGLPGGGVVHLGNRGFVLWDARWPRPFVIPVCWEPSTYPSQEREIVRDAVEKSWEAHSPVRFVGWGTCAPNATGIRIATFDGNPMTRALGRFLDGMPDGMMLNFTFLSWNVECRSPAIHEDCVRAIGVHEFGHAIGFAHEQNRPDTPEGCPERPQGGNGDWLMTPWDPNSVMNYCNHNNHGILSQGDITSLRETYP